jgi:hypothetical protein
MAQSLADLLPHGRYDEPPEVQIIKEFVQEKFHRPVQVTLQQNQILIQVQGSALAGALRTHLHELQELCQTDKRLVLRIG